VSALPPPRRAVALALMIVAPVLWSTAGVLARQIQSAGAFEMAFWRSSFATIFVFGALYFLQDRRPWHTLRAAGMAGLLSGAMWAVIFFCQRRAVSAAVSSRTVRSRTESATSRPSRITWMNLASGSARWISFIFCT
jgi:drug/metabolite transporter (DMT)-like permease